MVFDKIIAKVWNKEVLQLEDREDWQNQNFANRLNRFKTCKVSTWFYKQ